MIKEYARLYCAHCRVWTTLKQNWPNEIPKCYKCGGEFEEGADFEISTDIKLTTIRIRR